MATQPLRRNHCNTDGSGSLKIASKSNYAPYPEVMIQFNSAAILRPFLNTYAWIHVDAYFTLFPRYVSKKLPFLAIWVHNSNHVSYVLSLLSNK